MSSCAGEPGAPAAIKLNAGVRVEKTRNVIAQTKTGSTADVVMVGAHLDSVPEGPGINDNGSGVAAVLETALQLGSSPQVANAVRFGFWGAEEDGLLGSDDYVGSLDLDALKDIALYLNFDMLGSPNPGYFTYDGDQSTRPDRGRGAPGAGRVGGHRAHAGGLPRPRGKAGRGHLVRRPLRLRRLHQGGNPCGRPVLGCRGEEVGRSRPSVWGGQADQPFDPNYHKADRHARQHRRDGDADPRQRRRPTRSACTRRINGAATEFRSARTAPATADRVMRRLVGRGAAAGGGAGGVVFVEHPGARAGDLGPELAGKVTIDGVYRHLVKLQEIADANDGNRADGSPGYQASVDYVAQTVARQGVSTCRRRSSSGSPAPRAASRC